LILTTSDDVACLKNKSDVMLLARTRVVVPSDLMIWPADKLKLTGAELQLIAPEPPTPCDTLKEIELYDVPLAGIEIWEVPELRRSLVI
jgi:hypothetical protein